MTNKVIYKLKGHEKFPLREGWINKGLSVAKEKGTHIVFRQCCIEKCKLLLLN